MRRTIFLILFFSSSFVQAQIPDVQCGHALRLYRYFVQTHVNVMSALKENNNTANICFYAGKASSDSDSFMNEIIGIEDLLLEYTGIVIVLDHIALIKSDPIFNNIKNTLRGVDYLCRDVKILSFNKKKRIKSELVVANNFLVEAANKLEKFSSDAVDCIVEGKSL